MLRPILFLSAENPIFIVFLQTVFLKTSLDQIIAIEPHSMHIYIYIYI